MVDKKEREQLIGSILNELNELEMLTQGMQDPRMLEELAIKKTKQLLRHYEELRGTAVQPANEEHTTPQPAEAKTEEQEAPPTTEQASAATAKQEPEPAKQESAPAKEEEAKPAETEAKTTEATAKAAETEKPAKAAPPAKEDAAPAMKQATKSGKGVAFIDSIPVKSLKSALTMGDRFRYNSELFKGNMGLLNSTIAELDAMQNLGEALAYINANFSWDGENEAYADFMQLLERRFSY